MFKPRRFVRRLIPRYSLRSLFIAITIASAFCYWLARPTLIAHRFMRAIAAGDYATAETLFLTTHTKESWVFPGPFGTDDQIRRTTISLFPLTLRDIVLRQRYIGIDVPYGKGQFDFDWQISAVATPWGIEIHYVMT